MNQGFDGFAVAAPGLQVRRIDEVQLGTAAASISFAAITQIFRNLRITVVARGDTAATTVVMQAQFNLDTGSNYDFARFEMSGTTTGTADGLATTSVMLGTIAAASAPANEASQSSIQINHYTNQLFQKTLTAEYAFKSADTAAGTVAGKIAGFWRSTAPITRITIAPASGNFIAGSIFTLYGEP